ncbi:MAG: molybdopterin-dependent oxidoreductase, partial [Rhodospirillaceae bacterium]|nr:molybdopterin-dependent oxidoreductase [Rhodospirillaceae bacterium]
MKLDNSKTMNRRQFLIKSGWLAVGVTATASCSPIYSSLPALPSTDGPEWADAITWIQIMPNGKARFYCPRMEMGQGAPLGLSQVVAEELNLDQSDVECLLPDTQQIPRFRMTVGSQSILDFFDPVSRAAANLRENLRAMAAERTHYKPAQIKDAPGGFVLPDGQRKDYTTLVTDKPLLLTETRSIEDGLKIYSKNKNRNRRAIGNPWKHHELEAIVTGQPLYARDKSLPNMLYGQVLRPAVYGSKLINADVRDAKKMPGVTAVVVDKGANFIGVVTEHPSQLNAALDRLKLKWREPKARGQAELNDRLNVMRVRREDKFEHSLVSQGQMRQKPRPTHLSAAGYFETSFAAHAAMEPRAAVVSVKPKSTEVWCGSQDPFFVQRLVAKAIGYASDTVIVYPQRIGGGFGGRVPCQASVEAAILSKAVARPVRVAWDRETEFAHNYFQPRYSHYISASATREGVIDSWQHDFVSSPIITGLVPDNIAWIVDKVVADEGTARGSLLPYQVKNQSVRYSDIRTPIPIGAWRGLGSAPNTFAIESMIDDLAKAAQMDPLVFRLKNLPTTEKRLVKVFNRVAAMAKWGRELPEGVGLGIAGAIYKGES